MVAEAVTFLFAALMHVGIPLGFSEPRIIPAAIVEGLCGLLLAVSACAVVARTTWAWGAALAAHLVAVAGVLLGVIALAPGGRPRTMAHTNYPPALLAGLVRCPGGPSTP